MPIRFACPHCEKTLKVDDRFAGRRAKCPNCRVPIEIPAQAIAHERVGVAGDSSPGGGARESGPDVSEAEASRKSESEGEDPSRAATDGVDSDDRHDSTGRQAASELGTGAEEAAADTRATSGMQAHVADAAPFTDVERPEEKVPSSAALESAPTTPPPFDSIASIAPHQAPAAPPVERTSRDPDEEQFASPFEVFDDDAEIVYAEGYDQEEPERFLVSRTRLAIPRAFVYLQGALLVAVAVLSFAIGWAFGGSGAFRASEAPSGPVTLSGTIRVDGYDGPIAASEGALVAILPAERRPAEKIPVDGLRPSEIGRIIPPRTLGAIREMGGALTVSDSRGKFEAELPQPGEYHVLTVLPDVYRPTTSQIALADLARLGDYFLLPDQLIGDCRYVLRTERVDESETIEIRFP